MYKLVFATNNKYKFQEVKELLPSQIEILSLEDIGCNDDLPETHKTVEENARQKAFFVYNKYQMNCFAEDTALEIEALNGRPGVYSARYAGISKNFDDNIRKVLNEMKDIHPLANRKARFRTVISLVIDGAEKRFIGEVRGNIVYEKRGTFGFGYDPIFQPQGYNQSFAEMTASEKNKISHRKIAVRKLAEYLMSDRINL